MAGSTPASSFSTGGLTLGPRRSMAALEDGCEKAGSLSPAVSQSTPHPSDLIKA